MTASIEIPGLRPAPSLHGKVLGLAKDQNAPDDTSERPEFSGLIAALRNSNRAAAASEEGEEKSTDEVDIANERDIVFTGSFNLLTLQADRSSKAPTNTLPDQTAEVAAKDADTSLTGEEGSLGEGGDPNLVLEQTPLADAAATQNPVHTVNGETTVTTLPNDMAGQISDVSVTTAQVVQAAAAAPVAPQQPAAQKAPTGNLARQTTAAEPAAVAAAIAPSGQPAVGQAKAKAQREPTATGTEAPKDQGTTQANLPAFSLAASPENRVAPAPRDGQAIVIQVQTKDAGADPAAQPKTMPDAGQPSTAQPQTFAGMMTSAAANDLPPPIDAPQQISDPIAISTTDPNWEVEFVDSIVAQVSGDNAVIDLALTPENLGKVEVRVELREGRADVSFVTETREAARLFTQAEGRLSDLMQRHGLDLGGQDTSHREAPARSSGNTQSRQSAESETATPTRLAPEGRVNLVA